MLWRQRGLAIVVGQIRKGGNTKGKTLRVHGLTGRLQEVQVATEEEVQGLWKMKTEKNAGDGCVRVKFLPGWIKIRC